MYGEKTALVPIESIKSVSILILMLTSNFFLQDSSGIFWDNDSLAGLLAIELKADLLVLLSDVDGLYSGPPSEPQSKIIHTYIRGQVTCR
jgi:glutamate 5-kinase